ncbi:fasciclin domain-containing protein [uncultured Tateyamaria sp.]|uniref:fasciclin domain-containing protein n=1 Tax=uncultured Tateyamaria sp. TaxID=455651 RepID=UPI00261DBCE3|nr:fasciclin domain-containing protein [uncultured Tateyamaria sp.]
MNRRSTFKILAGATALVALGACASEPQGDDIIDIAAGNPNFSTLVAAVEAAGLVDTLKGPGPFTLFAPTNDAFAALPAGTVESLLLPENKDQLVDILTYHVVPGQISAGDLLGDRRSVATVQGGTLDVNGQVGKFGTGVQVNGANVIQADIFATNGVIHAIDSVLLP